MPHLSLALLGPFQATLDGQPVTGWKSNKIKALLVYLAVEADRPHPREALAGLLWPDYSDASALSNLRDSLAALRLAIGDRKAQPPFLLISRETIQFNTACDYDLDLAGFACPGPQARENLSGLAVNRLEQVVALRRGTFMEGFACDSAPFEEWALVKREQLERQMLAVLHRLAEHHEQCGEYERAITYARRQLELEPWREEAHQQLMRGLALSGQRSAALAQYEQCRRALKEDLGVEPSHETTALYESICDEKLVAPDLPTDITPKKTLDVRTHNLPVQLTSFVGREREISEIKKLIAGTRLLTLTGVGGTGKTRLAIQVSADLIEDFADSVWLVQLAPLSVPSLVPQAVASVWGVHERPDRSLPDLLADHVRKKHLLLILDNCEHVADACAQLAGELLSVAPRLKILATSRATLNLAGETTYLVPPLSLPDPQRLPPLPALTQYEAVRLFIERALAVRPSFNVTNADAPAVAQICQHLDGIPLAIELAAARVRTLSPDQIAARLADRFNLLTGGSRTALPRQQTLRATMDWSYDLLTGAERAMLNDLSVFAGDFSLEAVESIWVEEHAGDIEKVQVHPSGALDLLTALVQQSLVIAEERNAETRYRLLETVRQYALEKLAASGKLQGLKGRHLAYYLKFAEEGEPYVRIGRAAWIERFEAEYDNLRAAMGYALADDPALAIQLAMLLRWFLDFTHRLKESHAWAMEILSLTKTWPVGKSRAMALHLAGDRAGTVGRYESGQALLKESLAMARMIGDKGRMKDVLHDLAATNWMAGKWAQMRPYAQEGLVLAQELGDTEGIADALWQLGTAACGDGDDDEGRSLFEQSLDLSRRAALPNIIAFNLFSLARLARRQGDYARARALYKECAQIRREMGHRNALASTLASLGQLELHERDCVYAKALFEESLEIRDELEEIGGQAVALAGLAGVEAIAGNQELAARLFGATEAAYESLDMEMSTVEHMIYDPIKSAVRVQLGKAPFDVAWAEGRKMTLKQAIELVQMQTAEQETAHLDAGR